MHRDLQHLPAAPPDREEDAKRLFPYKEMIPEEYHAKEGEGWLCFSFGEYRYKDPELDAWIHALDDIFVSRSGLL